MITDFSLGLETSTSSTYRDTKMLLSDIKGISKIAILVQLSEVDQVGPVDECIEAETTRPGAGEILDTPTFLRIIILVNKINKLGNLTKIRYSSSDTTTIRHIWQTSSH